MLNVLFACLMAGAAFAAHAARPFVTDDARLTTAGSCQLESWMRAYPNSKEFWALPACNPTGNLELTLGGGRARTEGEPVVNDHVLQVKTLFRQLDANGWGWGLAVGTVRHPASTPGPNQLGNSYAYLPISVAYNNDQGVLHANLGWMKDRARGTHNLTWGLGSEYKVLPRLLAITEVFGDNHNRPFWQVGARFWVVPDRVQIDATTGRQFEGPASGRWISFGLRLTPDRLF